MSELMYSLSPNLHFQLSNEILMSRSLKLPFIPRVLRLEHNNGQLAFYFFIEMLSDKRRVYLGVRTCELFLCFVAIVRVRVYYVDFFVFFLLRHW